MSLIASLPMYDRPELRDATNRYWTAIQRRLPLSPPVLSRPDDLWALWQSPDLFFAQTCGLPYRIRLHETVALVGTPDYGLEGCPPGYYQSVFVARRSDPRGTLQDLLTGCFAYNDANSQSGWAAASNHANKLGLEFSELLETGSHDASARAVQAGAADLAALDAQSWRLMQRYDAWTADLHVIDRTEPTPGLPYITAQTEQAPQIAQAVEDAIASLGSEDRAPLGLKGIAAIPAEAYMALKIPKPPAS